MPNKYSDTKLAQHKEVRRTVSEAPPATSGFARPTSKEFFTIRRLKELAEGKERRLLSPIGEAVLRHFEFDSDPGTADDAYLWIRNLGYETGYSTVRTALTMLCAEGYIEPCEMPPHATRPGPRSGYYRITRLGREAISKIDELLSILPSKTAEVA